MSNASPGTKPTEPAEDHQLITHTSSMESTPQRWPDDDEDQSWGSEAPTLRPKHLHTEYEQWERAKQQQKKQQAATDHLDAADTFTGYGPDDSVLRYSYKGTPPEIYSPKKEFIYTQPLVEKQNGNAINQTAHSIEWMSGCNLMTSTSRVAPLSSHCQQPKDGRWQQHNNTNNNNNNDNKMQQNVYMPLTVNS